MTAIPTARGDFIDSSELGFTLITECVIGPRLLEKEINWPDHTFAEIPVEERLADAVKQLNTAKEHGIDTISDRVIPGAGRDVRTLKRLAEQVPINIIVPTGWYTWRDLPGQMVLREVFSHLLENNPEPTLGDLFVRDIEDGILDTGVRAGTIKFATDAPGLTDDVRRVIRHSASAHRRTGVPLTTHTGIGIGIRTGLLQQEALEEEGVDLTRVNLGHVDWTDPDTPLDEFERALQKGSFMSFDTLGLDYQWPAEMGQRMREKRIERVASLIEKGYVGQIMLSHDNSTYHDVFPAPPSQYPTYTQVSLDLIPALKERGVTEDQVTQMMVGNPRRFFETKDKGSY